jgi:asparagine synthetase B (glutamine-hydrolysing)
LGTIGGLIGAGDEGEILLLEALETSERGKLPTVWAHGSVVLGTGSGALSDSFLGSSSRWSVAVSGAIDRVGRLSRPADPAVAIADLLDTRDPVEAAREVLGDFVCIATDGDRVIAFRDHLGTAGLFVGGSGTAHCVMSEPKQVVSALGRRRRADVDALVAGFFSQWEVDDDVPCVVEGVDRVPRGFVIEMTQDGWHRLGRVWDPTSVVETFELSFEEAKARAWELVVEAVARQLDGPTAVSLSGGIDSTLIAAALPSSHGSAMGALSAVYPASPSVDESTYIAATAEHLDLESTVFEPTSSRLSDVETWVDRCDGPTLGLAIGAMEDVNDAARRSGYKTLLSGEMGELVYDLREHAIGRMLQRGRLGSVRRNLSQLHQRGVPWRSLARIVASTITPTPIALAYTRRGGAEPPASWLESDYMPGLSRRWDLERPPSRRWPDIQLFFAMGPSYPGLEISTIIGDLAGVRMRRPLVDRELWDFFLRLPAETKFPDAWTKSLIRHMLDGRVPDSVVWRSDKTVFEEDSKRNADFSRLLDIVTDGFELPGVRYDVLTAQLEKEDMNSLELAMVRNLASIHSFVEVTS